MSITNIRDHSILFLGILITGLMLFAGPAAAQDDIPVREYTNEDEVVTFDRSTSFQRAIDVINEFSQENLEKAVIDRTGTEGSIGISVPPMHWRDALDLILRVKELVLLEQRDFFEIVPPRPEPGQVEGQQAAAAAGPEGEGPSATIDTREVRINAIFFEGSRRALQEIGVDWSTLSENVPANVQDFTGSEGSEVLPSTSTSFENQFVSVNSKGAQSVSQQIFNALVNFGEVGESGIRVQALFSAFEADNLGEILASPSVKVMDRELGTIQVGQDFSIKQRDFAGNVTDNFVSVGTILEVTPTLISNDDTTFIHLDVHAERSSAQPDPVSTIVNKTNAETQALLVDGEATAIAGLYRTESSEVRRGVPILKDLPPWFFGLRYLFGFNSKDRQVRELVILIQAEIEPSIPQRYGKEQISKFEVLKNARDRIQHELKEREEVQAFGEADVMESAEGQDTTEVQQSEEEADQQVETEPQSEEEIPQAVGDTTAQEETDAEIVDPEIKNEPVMIELGVRPDTTAEDQQPATEEAEEAELRYFIIGASFKNEENAQDKRNQFVNEGFDSRILVNGDSGYYLVAYRGYSDLDTARSGLADIQQYYNSEAWLYIKN